MQKKRDPYAAIGTVFACVAGVELAALLVLAAVLRRGTALSVVSLVLGAQALVFGGIGLGFLLGVRRRRQRREALLAGGYREMADVTGLEWVANVTVNGRHPCRVVCRIERGGVLHEYRSEALRFDPGLLPGMRVPVYLDPHDERRYYVDVESAAPRSCGTDRGTAAGAYTAVAAPPIVRR